MVKIRNMTSIPRFSGSYLLFLSLNSTQIITVGALGEIVFKAGNYLYVGSAMNGILFSRVLRHTKPKIEKKLHWHIDYLTALSPDVIKITKIFLIPAKDRFECTLAQILADYADAIVPRFGSSDCRCASHLFYFRPDSNFPLLLDDFLINA